MEYSIGQFIFFQILIPVIVGTVCYLAGLRKGKKGEKEK